MLIFRHRMSNPGNISYLQCKICNKEFPKYDQRGFRNAGFTAHQNRCIERKQSLKQPGGEQQPSYNKKRLLLPAPSPPRSLSMMVSSSSSSSSSSNRYYTDLANNSRQNQPSNQSDTFTFLNSPPPPPPPPSALAIDLSLFSTLSHHSVDINASPSFDLNDYNNDNPSNLEHTSERFFPIIQCDYCTPEHGLHQPNCLLLADIVSQAPSSFPPR